MEKKAKGGRRNEDEVEMERKEMKRKKEKFK